MSSTCRGLTSFLVLYNRNLLAPSSRCLLVDRLSYSTTPNRQAETFRNPKMHVQPPFLHHFPPSQSPLLHSLEYSTNKTHQTEELSNLHIGRNVELFMNSENKNTRSLALLFPWLLSKKKHIMKYANFYFKQGMDVLVARITPWQLLWPVAGSQVTAEIVMRYLYKQQEYENIIFHGFSVGGYLLGECILQMLKNPDMYKNITSRIVGQVFDSGVDYEGIPTGVPRAFTRNPMLQKSIEAYIRYHLKTFTNSATVHYIRSSDAFHQSPLPCPALAFFSKDDPVGTPEGNMRVLTRWEQRNVPVYIKCFESSPHVSHFHKHPKEYKAELAAFMDMVGMLHHPERVPEFDGKLSAYQLRSAVVSQP